jgi:hypothetical protein
MGGVSRVTEMMMMMIIIMIMIRAHVDPKM